jgi:hypothetical protein
MEGVSGLVAIVLGDIAYKNLKVQRGFVFASGVSLFGAGLIVLFEGDVFSPSFISVIGL